MATLQVDSITNSAGTGAPSFPFGTGTVLTKTAAYSITTSDDKIYASNASTAYALTFPTAVGCAGKRWTVVRTDDAPANNITLNTTGGQTISGFASAAISLATKGECFEIESDGTNLQIVSHRANTTTVAATITLTSFGTITTHTVFGNRMGDHWHVRGTGNFATGSGTLSLDLPSGYVIDTAKISANAGGTFAGKCYVIDTGTAQIESSGIGCVAFYDGSTSTKLFVCRQVTGTAFLKATAAALLPASGVFSYDFLIPISGWVG